MKRIYESPEAQVILLDTRDVITTSEGAESPWGDLGYGDW